MESLQTYWYFVPIAVGLALILWGRGAITNRSTKNMVLIVAGIALCVLGLVVGIRSL